MKKLTSFGLGIVSILAVESANASDIKLFVGGNIALNSASWDEKVDKTFSNMNLSLPDDFFGLGAEAGVRLKTNGIYNPGVTLAYDYAFDSASDIKYPANNIFSSLDVGFSAISATFDNYIRLNKSMENRVDLVVGVGAASIETNINLLGLGLSMDCHAAVLKAGLELQLTDVISMTLGTRMYMPVASQYFDTSYALKGGFKFSF